MRYLAAILFLFIFIPSFSQRDFQHGFVVFPNGDSVRGFLEYQPTGKVFSVIAFRKDGVEEAIEYTASDVTAFRFQDGKAFVSHELDSLSGPVFFEHLVAGAANLYRYGQTFYVEKDKWYKLEETSAVINDRHVNYDLRKKKYIGILNMLFRDCPDAVEQLESVRLSEKDLIKVATKYNLCKGSASMEFQDARSSFSISFFAAGGLYYSKMAFKTYAIEQELTGIGPSLQAGVELTDPRTVENLFAVIGGGFSPHRYSQSIERTESIPKREYDYTLDCSRISLLFGLKYIIGKRKLSPYVSGGYVPNWFLNGIYVRDTKSTFSDGTVVESRVEREAKTFYVGQFWGAVGVQKRLGPVSLFAEVRAEGLVQESNPVVRPVDDSFDRIMDAKSHKNSTARILFGVIF